LSAKRARDRRRFVFLRSARTARRIVRPPREDARQFDAQEALALPRRKAAFQQERTDCARAGDWRFAALTRARETGRRDAARPARAAWSVQRQLPARFDGEVAGGAVEIFVLVNLVGATMELGRSGRSMIEWSRRIRRGAFRLRRRAAARPARADGEAAGGAVASRKCRRESTPQASMFLCLPHVLGRYHSKINSIAFVSTLRTVSGTGFRCPHARHRDDLQ